MQHSSPDQGCLLPILRVITRPGNHHGGDGLICLGVNMAELARIGVVEGSSEKISGLKICETSKYLKQNIKLDFWTKKLIIEY